MKKIFLISLLLSNTLLLAQNPTPPSQENLGKMDFWIGQWNLMWDGGGGTNLIERRMNGRVIQENFEAKEGELKGYKGTSISTFNGRDGKWHQAWADNNGGYIDFIGIMDGDQRIFQTAEPRVLPNGTSVILRMRFYEITEDSFVWDWERSADNGSTWELSWRINYERAD